MSNLATKETFIEQDGNLYVVPGFFPVAQAEHYLNRLHDTIPWQTETITMFGRAHQVPRLVSWHGDPDAYYTYSGVGHRPQPWSPELQEIRNHLQIDTGQTFNSVLANLYRDGNDHMGWQSDSEAELGPNPWIASMSFGAQRIFSVQHKRHKRTLKIPLSAGSLLVMHGPLQKNWRHCLRKTKQNCGIRINLTYRLICTSM